MVLGKLSRDTANGSAATVRHQVSDAPLLGIPCLDSIINSSRAVGSQSSSPPPRPLARSTTSWDLKLARYEGHLGISASDYVLSARVRAWFFTLDADNWSEATSRCWMAWVALNSTGRRVRVTQWRRGHCSGEIGGCGPGGSHVGMDSDLNLLLADVGRLARATNQDRARHPSRPIGSVSIFGDWFAFHHWSLGGTSLYASDGRH